MWHRLRNLIYSLRSYAALRPDLVVRRRVARSLKHRPCLSAQGWFEAYGKSLGIAQSVVEFADRHLERYCGLPFGKLLPGDRLEADLHWTQVCWFDWELSLYDDVLQDLSIGLESDAEEVIEGTLSDLLLWLTRQLPADLPQPTDLEMRSPS